MITMSYEKDLGRVKGEQGVAFYPTATVSDDKIIIEWHCTEDRYEGELPDDTIIIPMVYYPYYNSETGYLSWRKRTDEGLPEPMYIKGDKGDQGTIQLDVEFVDTLPDFSEAREGVIYVCRIDDEDDKYDTYIYESDINDYIHLGLTSIDLSRYYTKDEIDAMFNTVYTKDAIDALIGTVIDLQNEILSIL